MPAPFNTIPTITEASTQHYCNDNWKIGKNRFAWQNISPPVKWYMAICTYLYIIKMQETCDLLKSNNHSTFLQRCYVFISVEDPGPINFALCIRIRDQIWGSVLQTNEWTFKTISKAFFFVFILWCQTFYVLDTENHPGSGRKSMKKRRHLKLYILFIQWNFKNLPSFEVPSPDTENKEEGA
mgnify:CR=1 FL=1